MLRPRALALHLALAGAAAGTVLAMAPAAHAQSAADKATARQLATEGIKLYQAGKYAAALDKLQRAQSLFNAPVHLLYIGRAHAKLDQLVDAAEAYRRLIRARITDDSPQAFRDAVAAAEKELPPIEPKIPFLKLEVSPDNVADLQITIDDKSVPAAVVGVDRPANPGQRAIRVSAPGYKPFETTVTLKHAQRLTVPIQLEEDPDAEVVPVPGPGGTTATPGGTGDAGTGPQPPKERKLKPRDQVGLVGFMAGLRAGGAFATGDITAPDVSNTATPGTYRQAGTGDVFAPGGGFELHAGVRIWQYITPKVYYQRLILGPGDLFDDIRPPAGAEVTTTTFIESVGIGVQGSSPRGAFGGFGEIAVAPYHKLSATADGSAPVRTCDTEISYTGVAFRVGGGAIIPVWKDLLNLTPFVTLNISTVDEIEVSQSGSVDDCQFLFPTIVPEKRSLTGQEKKTQNVIVVGIGGDFTFGGDSRYE